MGRAKGPAEDRERLKQQARERQRESRRGELDRLAGLERPALYGLLTAADAAEMERRKAKFAAA